MWNLERHNGDLASGRTRRAQAPPVESAQSGVPYEKTPKAVLWDMGVVLATTLSFVLAINLTLFAFHIG